MKYQCARCKEIFTHTAKLTHYLNEGNNPSVIKSPELMIQQTFDSTETSVCPFCHNIKFTEYIEPEPEIEDVISVDYVGVGAKISEGYKVKEIYAKTVTLVKPKPKEVQA